MPTLSSFHRLARTAPTHAVCALACALLLQVLLLQTPVRADERAERAAASSDYESLVESALREYRAHRFPEARSLFTQAHAVSPNARTLRGLGMVEFELRHYVESERLLERALAETVRPLSGALREETEQLWERADAFVAHYQILALPAQRVALNVDGVAWEAPLDQPISLAVGDHVLEFSAAGYATQRRRVVVHGGEHDSIAVTLDKLLVVRDVGLAPDDAPSSEPTPGAAPIKRPRAKAPSLAPSDASSGPPFGPRSDAPRDDRSPLRKKTWIWASVVVSAAALAFGLGFGLSARGDRVGAPISDTPIATRSGP